MTALDLAADSLLDVTLRLFARNIRPARNAEALDNMADILVEQFACPKATAVETVRGAMLRRAERSKNPRAQAAARRVRKGRQ